MTVQKNPSTGSPFGLSGFARGYPQLARKGIYWQIQSGTNLEAVWSQAFKLGHRPWLRILIN
jgi:hypothetical protein